MKNQNNKNIISQLVVQLFEQGSVSFFDKERLLDKTVKLVGKAENAYQISETIKIIGSKDNVEIFTLNNSEIREYLYNANEYFLFKKEEALKLEEENLKDLERLNEIFKMSSKFVNAKNALNNMVGLINENYELLNQEIMSEEDFAEVERMNEIETIKTSPLFIKRFDYKLTEEEFKTEINTLTTVLNQSYNYNYMVEYDLTAGLYTSVKISGFYDSEDDEMEYGETGAGFIISSHKINVNSRIITAFKKAILNSFGLGLEDIPSLTDSEINRLKDDSFRMALLQVKLFNQSWVFTDNDYSIEYILENFNRLEKEV